MEQSEKMTNTETPMEPNLSELLDIPKFLRRDHATDIPASSNGRTPDFDSGNTGSNPEAGAMACRGILVGMRPMKVTGKLRIEIEIEKELANDAFEKLGKFVDPAKSRHVALAVINGGE